MLGTLCSWLHGDPRGFRDRHYRIHSSGDYKHPPPESEHVNLRRYFQERSASPVNLDINVRVTVCREFIQKMSSLGS